MIPANPVMHCALSNAFPTKPAPCQILDRKLLERERREERVMMTSPAREGVMTGKDWLMFCLVVGLVLVAW